MKKLLLILAVLCLAGGVRADSIGGLDTTAGSAVWANSAGYYKGGEWTPTTSGTLDSMSVIFQLSGPTGLKYCVIRSSDSSIVDSTIIDTFGPDTSTFTLAFVGHDSVKADTGYILMIHAGSSPYLLVWNWTDSASAKEAYFTEAGHGQPGAGAWENPILGMTVGTIGKPRMEAFYTAGGGEPAATVTSKWRQTKPRVKIR